MNTSISQNPRFSKRHLALITFVLLLVVASRMLRLYGLDMNSDEIWSVWQTLGTPLQILHWTPYDWPPLYYLLLGGWRALVGIDPTALRMLSISLSLVGTCCVYRVVRRLRDNSAALIVTLVYAALGYSIYIGITVRGHIVAFALMPLALWLTLRYFTQPTLRRAVPLALCMTAMFYAYLTSVVGFAMIGLFTLIVYRQQVWRWWLPGIMAGVLALPEILSKRAIAVGRVSSVEKMATTPLLKGLQKRVYLLYRQSPACVGRAAYWRDNPGAGCGTTPPFKTGDASGYSGVPGLDRGRAVGVVRHRAGTGIL